MWRQQKEGNSERLMRLFVPIHAVVRIGMGLWALQLTVVELAVAPHRWRDVLMPVSMNCFLAFQYAMALPNDGQRGRRRKLALAKLKEMFGTAWMPAPVGSGKVVLQ